MMIALFVFTLLMCLICISQSVRIGISKFDLTINLVFSILYLLLAIFIWKGGKF